MLVSAFHREQRQKEATKTAVVNSFPKDRDYRREAMQASAAPGFTGASKYSNTYYAYRSAASDHKWHAYMFDCLAELAQNIKDVFSIFPSKKSVFQWLRNSDQVWVVRKTRRVGWHDVDVLLTWCSSRSAI